MFAAKHHCEFAIRQHCGCEFFQLRQSALRYRSGSIFGSCKRDNTVLINRLAPQCLIKELYLMARRNHRRWAKRRASRHRKRTLPDQRE